MAGVTFKVNTDRLSNDADQFLSDISRMMSDIDEINSEINALGEMWKGEANTALTQSFNESHQWMVEVLERLAEYARLLSTDANEYNKCESKAVGFASNI